METIRHAERSGDGPALPVLPEPEILSQSGDPAVATVFVANLRPGDPTSMVEFVDGLDTRHPRADKWIANISTQFGCPVKCRFCDAGHAFHGNPTTAELLTQVRAVLSRHPETVAVCKKLKVHFARMGEPAFNDKVLECLRLLPGFTQAPGLWACVATTAPEGRERWFDELLEIKDTLYRGRFQLQFSVNTTDPATRRRLMPIALNGMDWMAAYARRFVAPGDRTVVLNFALADAIPFEVAAIAERFDPRTVCVKLTPLNPTATGAASGLNTILRRRESERLAASIDALHAGGFEVVVSIGDGREDEIGSNCGQSVRARREGRT